MPIRHAATTGALATEAVPMSDEPEVLQIVKRIGAFKTRDHFVGVSGLHFDSYMVKDILFARPTEASRVGELLALRNLDLDIEVVAGPATGGILLAQWTAFHLSRLKGQEVYAVFTEKASDKGQILGRGYGDIVAGRKMLVLEDSVRTGGTVKKVLAAITACGGEVTAVSAMFNVSPGKVTDATFGVPFRPLAEISVISYHVDDCPMCKQGIPVNVLFAHGKAFVESRSK